jgi:Putative auto-transporter adhesin, head GIN domain
VTLCATNHGEQAAHRSRLAPIGGLVLTTAGVVLLAGCTGPASSIPTVFPVTQTRSVAQFSRLDLVGRDNVTVTDGVRQSVAVRTYSALMSQVTTHVADRTLIIANTGSIPAGNPSVEVSVPSLAALELSGSGQISVSGVKAQRLIMTISGNGLLYASGSTAQLDVTLSGGGTAELNQLVAANARAMVTGSGVIEVTATASLDAAIPGDGAIIYSGNPPRVTTSISGTGTVTRG